MQIMKKVKKAVTSWSLMSQLGQSQKSQKESWTPQTSSWSHLSKANKKVMSLETKCWHLEWKVEYLEKKLKQIDPNVGLYERDEDDPYEKEKEERYNGSAD